MNVGDPNFCSGHCEGRESDMLIVAMITEKVKAEGAKGHYCNSNFSITNPRQIDGG
jgi:hypothetical protein